MSRCNDERCGQPQVGAGRPRKGWISVKESRDGSRPLWYCSTACIVATLTSYYPATIYVRERLPQVVMVPPDQLTEIEALQLLSVLGGQPLNLMTATETRVRAAIENAVRSLLRAVHAADERDQRDRPTIKTLIAEASDEFAETA